MRTALASTLGVLALGLAGCPQSTATEPDGTYVHAPSGLRFPASAAGFQRITIKTYDEVGEDVGVGYRWSGAGTRVEATVYVYPPLLDADGAAVSMREQFDEEIAAVFGEHSDVNEVFRADSVVEFRGAPCPAFTAEFEFRTAWTNFKVIDVASFITVFDVGGRRLKYRVTVPRPDRDKTSEVVGRLVEELGLPPSMFRAAPQVTPPVPVVPK